MSAEQQGRKPRKAGALRRWAVRAVVLFALLAAAVGTLYLGRERWLAPLLVERAGRIVREATGLELTVDRLGGDWWRGLEVEGLALQGSRPTTELTSLRIARVVVAFDLRRLLRGDPGGISSVHVDGAEVALDLVTSRGEAGPRSAAPAPFPWPRELPALDLRGVGLSFALGSGTSARVDGLRLANAQGPRAGHPSVFDVSAARGEFADASIGTHVAAVELSVDYRAGLFASDSVLLDGRPTSRSGSLDLREIGRGDARFGAQFTGFGGEQEFRGEVADGRLAIWVETETLDLAALLSFLTLDTTLGGRVSLTGVWEAPLDAICDWRAHAAGFADAFWFDGRVVDHLEIAGRCDAERLELSAGTAWQGANTLRVADFGVTFGEDDLDDLVRSLRGAAEVQLFEPTAILGAAPPEVLRAAERVRRAELVLECSPFGFTVRSGEIESDVGGLSVRRGTFDFGALDVPWYEGLLVDLEAEVSFADVAPLFALFGRGDCTGSLAGSIVVEGPILRPAGRFDLAGRDLSLDGYELGEATIEARADRDSLELTRLDLDGALGQLAVRGKFDYPGERLRDVRVTAETRALDQLSAGRATASFAAVDAAIEGPWRDPVVQANVRAWDLAIGDTLLEAFEVEGRYAARCVQVERLDARVAEVEVAAAGSACFEDAGASWRIQVESARLSRDALDLALEAPVDVAFGPDGFAVRDLRVQGSAGRAVAELVWTDAEQQGSLEASELHPMHLLAPFLPADVVIEGVQGSCSFRRTGQDLVADGALRIAELRAFEGAPSAALALDARLSGTSLDLRQLALSAPGHFGLALRGRIPTAPFDGEWLAEGPLELAGEVNFSDLLGLPPGMLARLRGFGVTGKATFDLAGTSSDVRGTLEADFRATPPPDDTLLARAGTGPVQLESRMTLGDELTLERARIAMEGRASVELDGKVAVRVDPRRWLAERGLDWRALAVSLDARLLAADLAFIGALTPALRRTGGELTGDLHVEGTLGEPAARGSLELARGELRLANSLAPFERLAARFELEGTHARIVTLTGDFGAAPFSASGSVEFASGEPVFDLALRGEGILLARDEGLRLRADAELALRGPLDGLELSGAVTLVEGRFSQDIELVSLPGARPARRRRELELPFLRQAPWANVEFEVAVRAAKPVRIETNFVRGSLEPRLVLRGSGAAPRLEGTLLIGPTRVKLPAATLEVTSGILTFRGESSLVPHLDITAVTRVRGFDVTAQVGGTSADPELLFSSSPPLASEELAVLVLTGQLPESALSAQGSEAAVQTVAVYLGRDLMTRWMGLEGEGEDPLAERLEIYRGADVSQTGTESTEFVFRLTPNPKGKRRILYLRAEQDIYEDMNFGLKVLFRFQ